MWYLACIDELSKALSLHRERGTGCHQSWSCCSRLLLFFTNWKDFCSSVPMCSLPSVLWRCWLGGRKGIRPVKNWAVGCWCGYLPGELHMSQTCICPIWCHCHSLSLVSVKSRLVLPFWYRLTQVVQEKGPLNARACVCVCLWISGNWLMIILLHALGLPIDTQPPTNTSVTVTEWKVQSCWLWMSDI